MVKLISKTLTYEIILSSFLYSTERVIRSITALVKRIESEAIAQKQKRLPKII